ncbi:hypothetical protein ABDD95_20945 [Mucilaginibacter sp. PAMB04274]|uniref:hypothetical protein n=1 Tax=Mucilaginibacter sp. PAMB04274 TaxID=3138568 RepID=UPI0031F64BBA
MQPKIQLICTVSFCGEMSGFFVPIDYRVTNKASSSGDQEKPWEAVKKKLAEANNPDVTNGLGRDVSPASDQNKKVLYILIG